MNTLKTVSALIICSAFLTACGCSTNNTEDSNNGSTNTEYATETPKATHNTAGDAVGDVIDDAGNVVDDAGKAVDDAADSVGDAIKQ